MRFVLLAIVTLTAACDMSPQYCEGDWAAAQPSEEPATSSARVVAQVLPVESTAVDILFVIDDSISMTDEQEQLGIWSSEMFDVLSSSGQLPDLHVAVTSTSVPIAGLTQCQTGGGTLHVGSATLQGSRYLTDIAGPDGSRQRNYTGTITDTFAKMAHVGDTGCGYEQPFKAARLALSGSVIDSKGFLRPDALLLVVFVTDEDDCSSSNDVLFGDFYADACSPLGTLTSYRCFEHGVTCYDGLGSRVFGERHNCHANDSSEYEESISAFADFLKSLKKDPAQVVVAGIYGKPNRVTVVPDERLPYQTPRLENICGSGGREGTGATPAFRLNALLAKFGGRASQSSICDGQLSWAMHDVGLVTREAATRSHCLRGRLFDANPAVPGVQPSCHVEAVTHERTPLETRRRIPACTGGNTTGCFTIADDARCIENESELSVHVADQAPNETLVVSCDVDRD